MIDPKETTFHQGIAERVLLRLSVLNEIRNCFDARGTRTSEGHRLYQKHFTGDKAWFRIHRRPR